jgi:hypothetical protein
MTSTLSPPRSVQRPPARRKTRVSPRTARSRTHQHQAPDMRRECRVLARHTDASGRAREVVAQPGFAGSVLVVDRELASGGDRRLVAHLAADEPAANAALECERYLADARRGGCRCRLLSASDLRMAPFSEDAEAEGSPASPGGQTDLLDQQGRLHRLEPVQTGMSIPELRWRSHSPAESAPRPVSVRDVIAHLEAYEPVCAITAGALARHRDDAGVSIAVLRAELQRVLASPIVLNRALRQATQAAMERQELSLSEIAIRCGRIKRDLRGNESGETSWLARRLGMLPEGGRDEPTPWIHSDVLALIARRGLGVSPREVELQ